MATATKKPVHTLGPYYSAGSRIEVACWKNQAEKDGKKFDTYAVSFSRSYKDGNDWKKTTSLRLQDIPVLQFGLAEAYRWVMSLGSAKEETPEDGDF